MRKPKKMMLVSTDNRTYKSALHESLGLCIYCKPNKGCNRKNRKITSWKKYKNKQWE